jgi:hypothetical protein
MDRRQMPDRLAHGHGAIMGAPDQLDRPETRGKEHHPAAALWQTVLGAIDDLVPDMVAVLFQGSDEIVVHRVFFHRRHVLHGDELWANGFDQACEFVQQCPSRTSHRVVALGIARKRLTRCTSSKDANVRVPEEILQNLWVRSRNVFLYEEGLVVRLERMVARRIDVYAGEDWYALQNQAV